MPDTQEPISLSCFNCFRLAGLLKCDNMSGQTIEPSSCQSQSQSIKPNWLSARMAAISTQTFTRTRFWHLLLLGRDGSFQCWAQRQQHEWDWAIAAPTLNMLYNFPRHFCMFSGWRKKNNSGAHVMKFNLSYSSRISLTLSGRSISSALAFSLYFLFIHSLLVWLRLANKKKETTLSDRNPQQLSEGFSSKTKFSIVSNREGGKKTHLLFLVPDLGIDEIWNRSCDRTRVIEGLGK